MPKIAIVLPVYNVEHYLPECLDSIFSQTYENFIIFAVDDGSTDNSGKILDEYASRDKRIKVTHKSNSGVSSARNVALNMIFNEKKHFYFLSFIDPDDRIPQNFLAEMTQAITEKHTDLALCPYIRFDRNGPVNEPLSSRAVLNADEIASTYLAAHRNKFKYGQILMNKLFKLECISGIYFDENLRTGEDIEWFIKIIPFIKSCITVPTTNYQYRLRNSSLSKSWKISQGINIYSRILQTQKQYKHFSQTSYLLIYENFINDSYREIKDDIYSGKQTEIIKKKIASIVNITKKINLELFDKKSKKTTCKTDKLAIFILKMVYFVTH